MNWKISIESGSIQNKDNEVRALARNAKALSVSDRQNRKRSDETTYSNVICAFDIETTRLEEIEQSIMYIWQFALLDIETHSIACVYGRTWGEFQNLMLYLDSLNLTFLIYVHNLSYEFQWLRSVLPFDEKDVFALKSRTILKFIAGEQKHLEFRCSYQQTHKSLDKLLNDYDVENKKLSFDYTVRRYPWSHLTSDEIAYCVNDVIGLVQAMYARMRQDNDNLYTIPYTSTGYVRRMARNAMKAYNFKKLHDMMCNYEVYTMLREEFRGGDTHANRYFVGQILNNVHSFDRVSSYPDVMLNGSYPMGKFRKETGMTTESDLNRLMRYGKALLFRVTFDGLEQRDVYYGCPYLSCDKGRNIKDAVIDNGRILSATSYTCTLNDIDFEIIRNEYKWESITISDVYSARYGKLPEPLRQLVRDLFCDKTALKDVEGKELDYALSKELINALYGMCAQNPVKPDIIFHNIPTDDYQSYELQDGDPVAKLEKYNRKAFLLYAWGCWVTALARKRLKDCINIIGDEFVYSDTDSVKFVETTPERMAEIESLIAKLNTELKDASIENGGSAIDQKGKTHYLGVYEYEGKYDRFITLGAKKYAYEKDGKLSITIAGVNKKKGAVELGCLENLKIGFTFYDAGGLESVYNDIDYGYYNPDPENVSRETYITRNVCLRPSTYTVGLTMEYLRVINSPELWKDFNDMMKKKC